MAHFFVHDVVALINYILDRLEVIIIRDIL